MALKSPVSEFTGTLTFARFIVRRDRVRMVVWLVGIALLVGSTPARVNGVYPTQADLNEAAAATAHSAAAIAFKGPAQALDTLGGQVAFQVGGFGLVVVGLMTLLTTARLTRAEEETGRTELVRSMPVGRYAPTAAALLVVAAMNMQVGNSVAVSLVIQGLPVTGSVVLGASFAALGFVFAGVAAVVAQITENTRVVSGVSGTVLGAAFVVRGAGDVGDGTLSWLSPIGWSQKARPFAGERWWPLLVSFAFAAGLVVVAGVLTTRRDIGAGILPPRPGPRAATPRLGRPWGLALRLQRGSLVGWSLGTFLLGAAYGSVANDVDELLGGNEALNTWLARAGGASLTDSFLATSLLILALIGTGYSIQSTLRLRSEAAADRAEPVLATGISHQRWAASHLTVALAGSVVVLAAGGLGMGLTYGVVTDDFSVLPRLLGAALAYTPALWLLVGLTVALCGLAPRGVPVAWAALAFCVVGGLLGDVFDLPSWIVGVSPYQHVPRLPAAEATIVPLAVLATVAAGLTAVGLTAFRRRDVG
jgi:ABC-2 type transport system permease protein